MKGGWIQMGGASLTALPMCSGGNEVVNVGVVPKVMIGCCCVCTAYKGGGKRERLVFTESERESGGGGG